MNLNVYKSNLKVAIEFWYDKEINGNIINKIIHGKMTKQERK